MPTDLWLGSFPPSRERPMEVPIHGVAQSPHVCPSPQVIRTVDDSLRSVLDRRRIAVSKGCAVTGKEAAPGAGNERMSCATSGDPENYWSCGLCTLHNNVRARKCSACGSVRSDDDKAVSIRLDGSKMNIDNRERRVGRRIGPGYATLDAATQVPDRGKDPRRAAATQRPKMGVCDRSSCASRGARIIRSTWRCRRCPFSFPNPVEALRCQSCGAPKEEEGEKTGKEEVEAWACNICTVLNPATSLSCGTCEAPRPSLTRGSASDALAANEVKGRANGVRKRRAPPASVDSDAHRDVRTCGVCTVVNTLRATACVACGTPLLRSSRWNEREWIAVDEADGAHADGRPWRRLEVEGESQRRVEEDEVIDLT